MNSIYKKIISLTLIMVVAISGSLIISFADDNQNYNNSINILKELGANIEMGSEEASFRSANVKDNDFEKVIFFNKTSKAVLDEENRIIQIDRIKEVDLDYPVVINFKDTKKFVESNLIKNGYDLVYSDEFDENTLALRYEKNMFNGGHDEYDAYDVYIDVNNGQLISFKKKGVERVDALRLQNSRNLLSQEEAKKIANDLLAKFGYDGVNEIEIGTAIYDDDFMKSLNGEVLEGRPEVVLESNIHEQKIYDVYICKNDSLEVYIDMYTGKVIGGDFYLYYYSGSITAPDIKYPKAGATDAKAGLTKLGYDPVNVEYKVSDFEDEATDMLSDGLNAFYASGHASTSRIGTKKDGGSYLSASDVPDGNYNFVFLAGCNTGKNETWSNAFGIYNGTSQNKAFLGWYQKIKSMVNYNFCWQFWNETDEDKSIRNAALDATNNLPQYCPIRFRGNSSYNGYY